MATLPATPPPAPLAFTVHDIIIDAAIEIGIIAPGDEDNFPDGTAQWMFRKTNYMMDNWSAMKQYIYTVLFNVYTLIPNHAPHTIGPTGDFVIAQRPTKIMGANLLLNGSSTLVDCPIEIVDAKWWDAQQTKNITSTVPTQLYYAPAYENGELNFWPIPSEGRQVRLEMWGPLATFTDINDPIGGSNGPGTLPQGYRAAMMYTLAELCCPGSNKELHGVLQAAAKEARKAIFGNNIQSPRIASQDSGMPRAGRNTGQFNYGTGGPPGQGPR